MEDIFYFGSDQTRLFGAWHPPDSSASKTTGVVVCSSLGQEAIGGHVLCRRLAVVLARCGYPVLRFDYFGTGDSLGDSREATIDQWLRDIDTAVAEVRRRSGCQGVCLVGLRFGATLAMLYGAQRDDLDAIAAVSPVTSGRAYLAELRQLEAEEWRTLGDAPPERLEAEQARALTGIAYTAQFLASVEAVELKALDARPARYLALFEDGVDDSAIPFLRTTSAFAGGFDHLELGARTEPALSDFIWPAGRAPHNVSDWMRAVCP